MTDDGETTSSAAMRARIGRGLLLGGLLLWIAALVLPRHLASYGLLAAIIGTFLVGNFSKAKWLDERLLLRVALPAVVLVALLWSADVPQGLRDVGVLMSLAVAAVIVQSGALRPADAQLLLRAFVLSALAALGWMLLHGLGLFALIGLRSHLSYHPLAMSIGRTAPYASYLLGSALIVLAFVPLWRTSVRWALAIVLLVGLWLLAVKAVLVACLVVIAGGLLAQRGAMRLPRIKLVGGFALVVVVITLLMAIAPARERMLRVFDADWSLLSTRDFKRADVYLPELPLRVLLWRESLTATDGSWLAGLGTGSQTRALRARLDALHLHPRLLELNSHSLYLHVLMAQGLLGLGALALLFVGWGRAAPVALRILLVFFALVGLTEVWLFRHDGVFLYALLLILLSPMTGGRAVESPVRGIPSSTLRTGG